MRRKRVAVIISGRGSNLRALIGASEKPNYPATIALIISNRPGAEGLEHGIASNIPTLVIDHERFRDAPNPKAAFEEQLNDILHANEIELVCLAGFMRLLSDDFVNSWAGRILNIHPSLLPAFRGLHVQRRTLESGVKIAGCTVHIVSSEMDAGPIIGQAALCVQPDDTIESLTERILRLEHTLYPACLAAIASGSAKLIDGAKVALECASVPISTIATPSS
ncbi:MAG: phosphoribosylglycinamide formyltransferase [Alphaproteobacteria bacterium]|nr:phosphoribosylglycinamide formyltransferase [Alphaproteobacteria bacterium]